MRSDILFNARKMIKSPYFAALLFVAASVCTLFRLEFYFSIAFVFIICVILCVSDDILDTTLPFLLLAVFIAMCYNSYNTYIKLAPFAAVLIFSIVFHFVKYKKSLRVGDSFGGVCAVAVAISLGGLFRITSDEYFSGSSLYHTFGLGLGMVILYLMMKSQLYDKTDKNEQNMHRFAKMMYLMGMLAFVAVVGVYIREFQTFWETKHFLVFHSRNNYATFLMLAMPFPCYFAIKNRIHLTSLAVMYGGILLTNSRGGLIFGSIELLICLVYIFVCDKRNRLFYSICYGALAVLAVIAATFIIPMYASRLIDGNLISKSETRYLLMMQSFRDFASAPIFGVGLGYRGNANIYNSVSVVAMNWYHMMIPQIIGSMGLCGIIAYGYQIFTRFKLWMKTKNALTSCLFLSYIGLLLMSQVNPGEFCPIPYEFLTVIIFIFLENQKERIK